jgi:hypothetical protein
MTASELPEIYWCGIAASSARIACCRSSSSRLGVSDLFAKVGALERQSGCLNCSQHL